ncbi:hypothetical protein D9M68_758380 [compost metagenome]
MHGLQGLMRQRPARKAGVVAHAHGLDLGHQGRELVEVRIVDAGGRAQRQTHAVQADGVVLAPMAQHRTRGAAGGEEVFGMNLDEVQRGLLQQQLGVMGVPPTDAHGRDLVGLL